MRLAASLAKRVVPPVFDRGWTRKGSVLLVLSHMRSGSSLLTRILVSHPNIAGIGELHRRYPTAGHFASLYASLLRHQPSKVIRAPIALDKLLHDPYLPEPGVLADPRLRCIFLLRDPIEAISSLVLRTGHDHPLMKRFETIEGACMYYVERLRSLETYAEAARRGSDTPVFLTYDDLLHRTRSVLDGLGSALGLPTPLQERYRVDAHTGVRGIGDASSHIRAGHIVRHRDTSTVKMSPQLRDATMAAYAHAREVLSRACHPAV